MKKQSTFLGKGKAIYYFCFILTLFFSIFISFGCDSKRPPDSPGGGEELTTRKEIALENLRKRLLNPEIITPRGYIQLVNPILREDSLSSRDLLNIINKTICVFYRLNPTLNQIIELLT